MSNKKVTYQEQIDQGLIRQRSSNYVAPAPQPIVRKIDASLQQTAHVIDVQPIATQHVELKGSYVDRAKGYLMMHLPLFAAFALAITLVSMHWSQSPLLSWFSFNVFWSTFVGSWLISFILTILISPEGVAFIEASGRLAIIWREQSWRHKYYDRQNRGE